MAITTFGASGASSGAIQNDNYGTYLRRHITDTKPPYDLETSIIQYGNYDIRNCSVNLRHSTAVYRHFATDLSSNTCTCTLYHNIYESDGAWTSELDPGNWTQIATKTQNVKEDLYLGGSNAPDIGYTLPLSRTQGRFLMSTARVTRSNPPFTSGTNIWYNAALNLPRCPNIVTISQAISNRSATGFTITNTWNLDGCPDTGWTRKDVKVTLNTNPSATTPINWGGSGVNRTTYNATGLTANTAYRAQSHYYNPDFSNMAVNGDLENGAVKSVTVWTLPTINTPSAPTLTASDATHVTIARTPAPSGTATSVDWQYRYSTDGGTNWTTVNTFSTATSVTSAAVAAGATVTVQTRYRATGGNSDIVYSSWSGSSALTTASINSPNAPTVAFQANTQTKITRTPAPSATGGTAQWRYRYSSDGGSTWTTSGWYTDTTLLSTTSLTAGTTYIYQTQYRVDVTSGTDIESGWSASTSYTVPIVAVVSNIVSDTPTTTTLPNTRVSAYSKTGNPAPDRWQFRYENFDAGSGWTTSATLTANSYNITGLSADTRYLVQALPSRNGNWTGAWSNSFMLITAPEAGTPTVALSGQTATQIVATLSTSGGHYEYRDTHVWQYSTDNSNWTTAATNSANSYTFTGLTANTRYYIRVTVTYHGQSGTAEYPVTEKSVKATSAVVNTYTLPNIGTANLALTREQTPTQTYIVSINKGGTWSTGTTYYQMDTQQNGGTWTARIGGTTNTNSSYTGAQSDFNDNSSMTFRVRIAIVGANGTTYWSTYTTSSTFQTPIISDATGYLTGTNLVMTYTGVTGTGTNDLYNRIRRVSSGATIRDWWKSYNLPESSASATYNYTLTHSTTLLPGVTYYIDSSFEEYFHRSQYNGIKARAPYTISAPSNLTISAQPVQLNGNATISASWTNGTSNLPTVQRSIKFYTTGGVPSQTTWNSVTSGGTYVLTNKDATETVYAILTETWSNADGEVLETKQIQSNTVTLQAVSLTNINITYTTGATYHSITYTHSTISKNNNKLGMQYIQLYDRTAGVVVSGSKYQIGPNVPVESSQDLTPIQTYTWDGLEYGHNYQIQERCIGVNPISGALHTVDNNTNIQTLAYRTNAITGLSIASVSSTILGNPTVNSNYTLTFTHASIPNINEGGTRLYYTVMYKMSNQGAYQESAQFTNNSFIITSGMLNPTPGASAMFYVRTYWRDYKGDITYVDSTVVTAAQVKNTFVYYYAAPSTAEDIPYYKMKIAGLDNFGASEKYIKKVYLDR